MGELAKSSNTIFENSVYYLYGGNAYDCPYNYGLLITLRSSKSDAGYYAIQWFFSRGSGSMSFRTCNPTGEYETWHRIPSA